MGKFRESTLHMSSQSPKYTNIVKSYNLFIITEVVYIYNIYYWNRFCKFQKKKIKIIDYDQYNCKIIAKKFLSFQIISWSIFIKFFSIKNWCLRKNPPVLPLTLVVGLQKYVLKIIFKKVSGLWPLEEFNLNVIGWLQ